MDIFLDQALYLVIQAFIAVLCKVQADKEIIAAVIRASQATAIYSIDEKLMALQKELIQKANNKEDYDEIADEIFRLRKLRQKTTANTAARDE